MNTIIDREFSDRIFARAADGTHGGRQAPAISLRGVSKSYTRGSSTTRVVENVDFEVDRGKCVFLMGPSGSGKTTLLSIIGCVLTADSGDVQVMGHDVKRMSPAELAELRLQHIGFVFQRFHLIRGLTAAENVSVPLTLAGWSAARATRRATELLAQVGIADKATIQPHRLSVGQCQRVAFARALAADPDLILADEPTASLDAKTGHQALATAASTHRRLRKDGARGHPRPADPAVCRSDSPHGKRQARRTSAW